MYCSKCGKYVDDNAMFCYGCGQMIVGNDASNINENSVTNPNMSSNTNSYMNANQNINGNSGVNNDDPVEQFLRVQNCVIPEGKEQLIEFMNMAVQNINVEAFRHYSNSNVDIFVSRQRELSELWIAKYDLAAQKFLLTFGREPAFYTIDRVYKEKKRRINKEKNRKKRTIIIAVCLVVGILIGYLALQIVLGVIAGLLGLGRKNTTTHNSSNNNNYSNTTEYSNTKDSSDYSTNNTDDYQMDNNDSNQSQRDESEISPEFKQQVDDLEDFYNEYCDFMEKYASSAASGDIASMMTDYSNFMSKYVQYEQTLNNMNNNTDQMTKAEFDYFMAAYTRIMNRLANCAGSLY